MILFSLLPPLPKWMDIILDSTALAVLLLPASFFFVFRPLHAQIAERRQAEEALRETKDQLEAILHAIADAVTVLDANRRLIYANDVVALAAGYPSAEDMLRSYDPSHSAEQYSLIDETGRPFPASQLPNRQIIQGKPGQPVVLGYRFKATGQVRWSVVQARPIFDEQGKVQFVVTVMHDVTERKRAEEALKASEERFRALTENATDLIIVLNPDGTGGYVSASVERILGFNADEIVGRSIADFIHPDDLPAALEAIAYRVQTPGLADWSSEFRVRHKDGTYRMMEVIGNNLLENPAVNGIVVNARDVTERKRAEEQLRQRYEQTQAMYRLTDAVNQATALEDIYKEALDSLQRLLNLKHSALLLFDAEGLPRFKAWRMLSENYRKAVEGHSPWSPDAKNPQPVLVPDVEAEPSLEHLKETILGEGIHALAFIPLVHQGRLIGKFMIYYDAPHPFGEEEIQLVQAIADYVALAIGRAQAEEATRDSRDAVLNMLDDLSQARDREQARARELEIVAEQLSAAMEDSDRLAIQLAAINRLDHIISSSLDLDEIYRAFAEESNKIVPFDRMAVILVEGDRVRERAVGAGVEAVRGAEAVSPLPGSSIEAVIESGRALIRRDLIAEERYPTDRRLIEAGVRSDVLVPLTVKGRVLGTFNVASRLVGAYGEKDLPLLQSLADQLAIAVENAGLYSETQQRAGELAALYDITHDLAAQHDLPSLLQTIALRAATLLAAPGSSIYFYDAARGDLELVVTQGFPVPTGTRLQPGEGMAGRVAQTRQPLIVDDYHAWEHRSPKYAEAPFTAVVEVPMLYAGELIGVLSVHEIGATAHKFSEADARLLSLFAAQAAGAVHNARLYQKVLASEQEYRTLVENATELIWTLDAEGRFTYANRQAEEASGHKLQDWIGKGFAPLIAPPEDLPRIQQIFLDTLGGKGQNHAVGVYRSDGSVLYLSVNTTPLYREGTIVGTISFGRDVTAQQEAEAALSRRMAELSSLFEVSSALRGVEGVENMLPVIVDKAVEVCRADCGSVSLVDESGEALITRYGTGTRQSLVGARLQLGQGISGRVAQSGAAHLSPDFQHDPLLVFDPATATRLPEIASDACVPLRVGEQVVGAMHVSTYAARICTEAELRLLTAIADMAASAIRRAGLLEQLEHRVHELSALFDVGEMATASLHIEDVLQFVAGAATEAVHAEGSFISLWAEQEERLVLRASQGFLAAEVGRRKYRLGEGLAGWVFLERQVVNVSDVAADPRWKREPEHEAPLASGRVNGALIVPLVIGKKALGVLGVVNKIGAPAFAAGDESLLTALAGQIAIAIENARLYEDVRDLSIAAIRSLATAIDARDPYTRGHSEGVTELAVQVARELGWSGADLEMLEFAALLHDVGKIAVPDAVLRKVERLTADEWNVIRLHPYHSAQIVKPVESLRRIVPWVYHHQERWDGTGYPDGLKGEAIPPASRIIAVADAFNAMTTDRPYRKALSVTVALAEIERCAGKQFDPAVAAAFLRLMNGRLLQDPSGSS